MKHYKYFRHRKYYDTVIYKTDMERVWVIRKCNPEYTHLPENKNCSKWKLCNDPEYTEWEKEIKERMTEITKKEAFMLLL